ncbi:Sensors of blue-light using FAD [Polaromonas sp. YR568]|uniref:BLUF domain-containing protein n=1 Tax=Polaromonas sp. YR568 TaxID=1855301 RepID=UPI0008EB82D1|nr:BLUF domain-containing protein [Polaromonas sp. YR568]SFV04008.1 Sensors of blue-light using FAD [Polaromonas sp. YR568]
MTKISTTLYEILYVSTLAPEAPLSVVGDIAAKARIANAQHDITGLLIFDGMRFCQQLEGGQKQVLALLERIRQDTRHINMQILHHGELALRRFRNFSLGYCMVEDDDVLERMERLDGQAALDAFSGLLTQLDLDA